MNTITKETLEKLRDAGFHNQLARGIEEEITLTELIWACGENFRSLHKERDGWNAIGYINSTTYAGDIYLTPEEAVARLWLRLNTL